VHAEASLKAPQVAVVTTVHLFNHLLLTFFFLEANDMRISPMTQTSQTTIVAVACPITNYEKIAFSIFSVTTEISRGDNLSVVSSFGNFLILFTALRFVFVCVAEVKICR